MGYPNNVEHSKDKLMHRAISYCPAISVSPNQKNVVTGRYLGAILEILDIKKGRL